ncbi:MAG: PAS domain S-box protein [Nanoarchaeota archaeon]
MKGYKEELEQIKKFLLKNPRGLTVLEISQKLEINRNSVAKYLDVLDVSGDVEMKSIGPAKVYFLSHRVPLSAMLNFSSDYIVVLNSDLDIVQANDNLLNLMNIEREVFIGKNIEDCPDKVFTSQEMLSKIANALNGKGSSVEINLKKAKKECFFKIKLVPTTFEDGKKGATIILEDITKRKKAEEELKKFKAISDCANYGIAVSDLEGNFTYINDYFACVHGCKPEEVIGKNLSSFHNEEQLKDVAKITQKLQKTGSFNAQRVWHMHKDGSVFPMLMNGITIKDEKGKALFMATTAINLAEQKKGEI